MSFDTRADNVVSNAEDCSMSLQVYSDGAADRQTLNVFEEMVPTVSDAAIHARQASVAFA